MSIGEIRGNSAHYFLLIGTSFQSAEMDQSPMYVLRLLLRATGKIGDLQKPQSYLFCAKNQETAADPQNGSAILCEFLDS